MEKYLLHSEQAFLEKNNEEYPTDTLYEYWIGNFSRHAVYIRDQADIYRGLYPVKIAPDAHIINTSNKEYNPGEMQQYVVTQIVNKINPGQNQHI